MEKSLNLSTATTQKDVIATLDEFSKVSNQSIAYALKAQIQVIKYISTPSLCGSTFDLFFKYIKNALKYTDEESAFEMKDRITLILNNFVLFMRAKIEREKTANRNKYENLFRKASNDLAINIIDLLNVAISTTTISTGNITAIAPTSKNVSQLSKIFMKIKDNKDEWVKKIMRQTLPRWCRKDKKQVFCETFYRLAKKLDGYYNIIGPNDSIVKLFQNYRDDFLMFHYEVRSSLESEESSLEDWGAIYFILLVTVVVLGVIILLIWLIQWIASRFIDLPLSFFTPQEIFKGIIAFIIAIIMEEVIKIIVIKKQIKIFQEEPIEYYDKLIQQFSEK